MSLEEIKTRLQVARVRTEDLFSLINDLYVEEIRTDEKTLVEALSDLHNSREIDLVNIVGKMNNSDRGYDFFTILHAFEKTLPSLDASVEDVLHTLVHLTQQAGRDLAIGGVYGAFERFCRVKECRSRESISFILEQSELGAYAPFISSSILSYDSDHVNEAIKAIKSLISHKNKAVRSQAYFTLGKLDLGETQASIIWGILSISASSEHESGCCASILRATLYFGEAFPSYWSKIEGLLFTILKGAHPDVLYAISDIVAFQRVNPPENVINLLVKQLAHVSPEHKGIIANIDYFLVNLVERNLSLVAIELLESILAVGVDFKLLNYFSGELVSKHRELSCHIITRWLLSGEPSLCLSVSDLLHGEAFQKIALEADMTLLDDEVKQVFASHKAVGWLFAQPIVAAIFILSIYETASENTRKHLELVLYDPLLLSYPGELKRYFQSCIDKGNQVYLCERLLGKLQAYHTDIEKVSALKELMAPSENISAYWKESNKDMQVAYEEASKKSIFREIATVQNLLYGNSSVYYVHQVNGDKVRKETSMHTFSHSTEMPRLSVLDPASLDYTLRVFRYESIKK